MTAAGALFPVLLAIWTIPGFMTQDGPIHVYNAWILASSFQDSSPYQDYFVVQWQLLPNWAGHLALAGLMRFVSPWTADRVVMSLTLLGFAGSLVWLRWRVRGTQGLPGSGLLAAFLAMNFLWLLGFYSFLLGCCLFPLTLGVWWPCRDRLQVKRMAVLSVLLILGYFGHLVSLGLTLIALAFLALFAPAQEQEAPVHSQWRRVARTALVCLPLAIPGVIYLRLSRQGGPMHPVWDNLDNAWSVLSWLGRLGWVDPMTLARKDILPLSDLHHRLLFFLAPVLWFTASVTLLAFGGLVSRGWRNRSIDDILPGKDVPAQDRAASARTKRIWGLLGLAFLVAGLAGPDSLGSGHGEYLPQRVELLGLVCLVPALDFRFNTRTGRTANVLLLVACLLQTVIVWDYALESDRTAGQFLRAAERAGRNQRIATLLIQIRGRFRGNPVLHADGWLGVGTGNILWSNYEARYYYFPVQFSPGLSHPNPRWLEDIARTTDPRPTPEAVALWEQIMVDHHGSTDRVVTWHQDPAMDALTERWFRVVDHTGDLRIYAARQPTTTP